MGFGSWKKLLSRGCELVPAQLVVGSTLGTLVLSEGNAADRGLPALKDGRAAPAA